MAGPLYFNSLVHAEAQAPYMDDRESEYEGLRKMDVKEYNYTKFWKEQHKSEKRLSVWRHRPSSPPLKLLKYMQQ